MSECKNWAGECQVPCGYCGRDLGESCSHPMREVAGNENPKRDTMLLWRALGILHQMATEQTGFRGFFHRWYYHDEPLRNDAANLVREAKFEMDLPDDTQLVGQPTPARNAISSAKRGE